MCDGDCGPCLLLNVQAPVIDPVHWGVGHVPLELLDRMLLGVILGHCGADTSDSAAAALDCPFH